MCREYLLPVISTARRGKWLKLLVKAVLPELVSQRMREDSPDKSAKFGY